MRKEPILEAEKEKELSFSGLKRICDNDGNTMWVSAEKYQKIQGDLEMLTFLR